VDNVGSGGTRLPTSFACSNPLFDQSRLATVVAIVTSS